MRDMTLRILGMDRTDGEGRQKVTDILECLGNKEHEALKNLEKAEVALEKRDRTTPTLKGQIEQFIGNDEEKVLVSRVTWVDLNKRCDKVRAGTGS